MKALDRRLQKLEIQHGRTVLIVADRHDETYEETVARHISRYPDDDGAEFIVIHTGVPRWEGGI